MKIISNYHDYYDRIQGLGFDDRIVYNRKHKVLYYDHFTSLKIEDGHWIERQFENKIAPLPRECRFVVSFCGKAYIGCHYKDKKTEEITYDSSKILELVESEKNDICRYYSRKLDITGWECKTFEILHKEYNSPILAKIHGYLHINPPLKLLNFGKIVDAYTAFQQIEMWLTNIGFPNPPMIEISDRSKIIKHGHDPKYSFRKLPQKKR